MCLLLFSVVSAADRTVLLEGYVFDRETRQTLEDVNVQLGDPASSATTDSHGRFSLLVSQGVYRLSFSRIGYQPTDQNITVSGTIHPILYIEMTLQAIQMDTIMVQAQHAATSFGKLQETTSLLSGDELQKKYSLTLAETMKNELGVAIRSMGPAPARPVIRGLSGDRVRLNLDGVEMNDLSATSADHAVTLEPFNAERLEIIRGPRTLLFTASAIGGVINVVKHKIPETRPRRPFGTVGTHGETVNRGYLSAAAITTPVGPLAFHAETTYRDTRDLHTPIGKLNNTPINTRTHTLGLSYAADRGHIGASFDQFDTQYGIPGGFIGGHPNGVDLDILRRVFDGKAVYNLNGPHLNSIEMRFSKTFYHHFEFESSGNIGAEFLFHNYSANLNLHFDTQNQTRNTVMTLGFDHRDLKFGAFVFTPPTRERKAAIGLYHEFPWSQVEIQAAARYTYADLDPRPNTKSTGGNLDRTYHAWSAAVSPLVPFSDHFVAGLSLSQSRRVPTIEELYNEGPHLAAYSFEVGNIDLEVEASLGFEAFLHYLQPGFDLVLTGFWNEFDTYIAPRNTGEINFAQLLPIYAAEGIAARLLGLEIHLGWRPTERLDLELNNSYVHGQNSDDDVPLPEMPPFKSVFSATYRHPWLTMGGTAELAASQKRLDTFETSTGGYAVFGIYAQRDLVTNHTRHSFILSMDNLFNKEYRNHLSRIRSIMPEAGRSLRLNYRLYFF